MKRILSIGLALMLSLAACGGGTESTPEQSVDPDTTGTIAQTIVESGAFSEELEELDADTAFALYKLADYELEREDLTYCTVLHSTGATCEEAAVLSFGGESGGTVCKKALEAYIQGQIESNTDYRPAEIPKLENAWIEQTGAMVIMVVANDVDAARQALQP